MPTRKTIEAATTLFSKVVIPIYREHRRRPSQVGTGFFVRSGHDHFFVSAAHVLDGLKQERLFIYVGPTTVWPLGGRLVLTPSKGNRELDDSVDVGVLECGPETSPPYVALDKFAIDISYLRSPSGPRTGKNYVIVGFPASQGGANPTTGQVSATTYSYRGPSIDDANYGQHGLDPQRHLALPLDLRRGFDLDGNQRSFPKPQGMSGSPMWLMYRDDGGDDESTFLIAAIGTRYRRQERIVIGTDINAVLVLISRLSNQRLQPTTAGAS